MNPCLRKLFACLASVCCMAAGAAPLLRCEVSYADAQRVLEFPAGVHAYDTRAVDIGERFRFKAVLRQTANQVDLVKIYVYAITTSQAPMLQELRYKPPFAPQDRPGALTGEQTIYAQPLGRPLHYGCALAGLP